MNRITEDRTIEGKLAEDRIVVVVDCKTSNNPKILKQNTEHQIQDVCSLLQNINRGHNTEDKTERTEHRLQ